MTYNVVRVDANELSAAVGLYGVVKILEHRSSGEGDRWYYDVYYDDGRIIRTFTPNTVEFHHDKTE